MTDIAIGSTSYQSENRSWLIPQPGGIGHGYTLSGTLDVSAFTENTHYPNGFVASGTVLGRITTGGKLGPYAGGTNEVAVITVATSGNTTVTFDGESTGGLTLTADVTGAAALQAALEGLSNVDPGDVTVTVGADATAGKLVVTFGGRYAGRNVPNLAATGTGAGATITAGGSAATNGLQTPVGLLYAATRVKGLTQVGVGLVVAFAAVKVPRLPAASGFTPAVRSALPQIYFED